jgi:phosphoadenosine phosphosulfate reductase
MLIPSHRHTLEDLRLWNELEKADILNGAGHRLAVKVQRSIDFIGEFSASGRAYAGVSWGKDSVVLASLIAVTRIDVPLIWLSYGDASNPDCRVVRDCFLSLHPTVRYHEINVGESESMRDDFRPAARLAETDRYLSGVRAEESGTRRMSIKHHGISTDRVCRPLAWWTVADVFAYLAMAGLPVHPVYAMLGGGRWKRQHLRTASIGGERGSNMGRREWEQEYYGDVLNKLRNGFAG